MSKAKRRKLLLGCSAALAMIFGVLAVGVGYQRSGLRSATAGEPAKMTLAELISNGPDEERYIELRDFRVGRNYAIEEGAGGTWTGALAYIFKKGDRRQPAAIVSYTAGGEKGIKAAMRKKTLRGLVSAKPEPYEKLYGRKLREQYPNVKPGAAFYYIKHLAARPSSGVIQAWFISGFVLLALGSLLAVLAARAGDNVSYIAET
jgi:hypothetical protein